MTALSMPLAKQDRHDLQDEDRLFYRLLLPGLLILLLLSVSIPLLHVPQLSRPPVERILPQLAQVAIEPREITPPEPEPQPEAPVPEVVPEPVAVEPEVAVAPSVTVEQARAQAQQAGLLALQDELTALRQLTQPTSAQPQLQRRTERQASSAESQLLTNPTLATRVAAQTSDALGSVQRAELASDGQTQLGQAEMADLAAAGTANSRSTSSNDEQRTGGRSEAAIRQVLESNKSSLYSLYNRALRSNPLLRGKVVFELVIRPDGSLAEVTIVQSDLQDERLERQLQLRLQSVDFGAADVALTRSRWTIEFLPG